MTILTTSHINMRLCLLLMAFLMLPIATHAGNVIIETPLGDIELEMLEDDAPITVANFLQYVNEGSYDNSFIHRLENDFVIQGGGYVFNEHATQVKTRPPIKNEFKVPNTRGTVAMAKLPNNPNSATSQWFINLKDNSNLLDNQNAGYTVFARVVSGMEVADAINQLQVINGGQSFQTLPVIDYDPAANSISKDNLVMTNLKEVEGPAKPFVMNPGLNDAWFDPATNGQGFFVTVFPTLGSVVIAWFTYDTELPLEDATANLGDPGHRWMTIQGPFDGNTAEMTIDITSGGLFDTASTITHTPGGTVKLTFDDCNSGTVEYDIPSINQQGTIPIQRVATDNVALCEALQAAQ